MIGIILRRLKTEWSHYVALPYETKLMLVSFTLRNIAYPLIGIFTSAYIWRENRDITLLILYNIGNFALLPFLFLLNSMLLRKFRVTTLYAIGTVLTGLSALMVVFYQVSTPLAYFGYGMLYGMGNGIYWANRNFITLRHTPVSHRSYFTGLLFTLSTITSVAVPALAGWCIVLLGKPGYQLLIVLAFLILIIAGLIVQKGSFEQPKLSKRFLWPFSHRWDSMGWFAFSVGAVDVPLYIVPTVLVLIAVGNEGVLGTLTSVMAVITAGITYFYGRKQDPKRFIPTFIALIVLFIVAGLPSSFAITNGTVLFYLAATGIADNLIWTALWPRLMDAQDSAVERFKTTHYDELVRFEWQVNIGRIVVLLFFMGLVLWNGNSAIRLITVFAGLLALICTSSTQRIQPS